MKKLKPNASLLLVCLSLNSITSMFVYTFLLAHIIDLSSNSIINIAIFYLVLHVSMIVLSLVLAPLFKKMNKALILKLGIGVKFVFVVLVAILSDYIVNYVYIISICNALAEVVFWAGANALIPKATDNQSMQQFFSFQSIIGGIISIVLPPIIGMWIDKFGMYIISVIMVFVVAAQYVTSIFIKDRGIEKSTKIQYGKFVRSIKEKNIKTVKPIYLNMVLLGFCSNIGTLVLYFTYTVYNSNISLGIFSTITSILTIVFFAIFNIKKSVFKKNVSFIIYTVVVCISLLLIIFNLDKTTLIIFRFAWSIGNAVPSTVAGTQRLEIVQNTGFEKYNVENMTLTEVFLDLGRVIGEITLLLMGVFSNGIFNTVVMCCYVVVIIVHYVLTRYLVKKTEYIVPKTK